MNNDDLGYSPENARSAEQAAQMQQATAEKKCIFCDINFEKNKPLNRLGQFDPEGKDWPLLWVWENPYPQEYHLHHLMIIPKRHINNEEWHLITNDEWLQILDAWKWAQEFYNLPGGGFVGRFGQRSHNAGTIGHLHFQLQIPDLTGNVKATLFKDKSPAEEARRKNRSAYYNDEVTGYIYMNNQGLFLGENLRWQRALGPETAFVHTEEANQHICDALEEWKEDKEIISMWHATWKKETGATTIHRHIIQIYS